MARIPGQFLRDLMTVEEACFLGPGPSEKEVRQKLAQHPPFLADRVEQVAGLAAGRVSPVDYRDRFGACGTRQFQSADQAVVYSFPAETLPDLINVLYVVEHRSGVLLVDAGSPFEATKLDFQRAARVFAGVWKKPGLLDRVDDVVITHGHIDHFGGIGRLKERGARIHAHVLDVRVLSRFEERLVVVGSALRAFLERAGVPRQRLEDLLQMHTSSKHVYRSIPVDGKLEDGARVGPCTVWHTPGHCPGHICVQVDNLLMTGDHVLPGITPHQAPESIAAWTGLGHYIDSLERTRRLSGIDLGLPGHGEPITALVKRIAEIESFHQQRLGKVLEMTREPRTLNEISDALFPGQRGYGILLALEEAGAHVEYLAERGRLAIANADEFTQVTNPVVRYQTSST